MGFWSNALGLDNALAEPFEPVENRGSSYSIGDPDIAFALGYSTPGVPSVSEHSALTLSAVFRAVSIISGSIAGLPMPTMTYGSEGQVERSSSFLDRPGSASISDGVRLTNFEWKELITTQILLNGNTFLQHIRNGAGAIVALNPIMPSSVTVEWDANAYGGKLFKIRQHDGSTTELDGNGMTQLMGLSLDGLRGLSVITQARMSMGTALSGDKAANRQFVNGAMISGLVTPGEGETLTPDDAATVKDHINRTMLGAENAGDIPVVNRRLTYQQWQMSAQDAQFLESRAFQIDEVGRWFGVPPHLLGLTEKSTSWGQGIAEQNRGLSRYTLSNFTGRIEQRLSTLLPPDKWVEFDFTNFVKPSPEDEIKLLIEQVNSGLLTLNEARAIRNMAPVKGGDLNRLPAGSLPPDQWFTSDEPPPNPNGKEGEPSE